VSTLVERLKARRIVTDEGVYPDATCQEAAATITQLEGEKNYAWQEKKNAEAYLKPERANAIAAEARAEAAEATLAEATSATMMAEMRADKLMAEVERLKGVTSVSLLDRLSAAAERERELVEALRPFAVWAERMPEGSYEVTSDIINVVGNAIANGHLTGAHFRNAARVVQAKEPT
jgi:hypothetical protein